MDVLHVFLPMALSELNAHSRQLLVRATPMKSPSAYNCVPAIKDIISELIYKTVIIYTWSQYVIIVKVGRFYLIHVQGSKSVSSWVYTVWECTRKSSLLECVLFHQLIITITFMDLTFHFIITAFNKVKEWCSVKCNDSARL